MRVSIVACRYLSVLSVLDAGLALEEVLDSGKQMLVWAEAVYLEL